MYYVLEYKDFSDNEAQQLPRPIIPGDDDNDLAFDNGVIVPNPPARIRFSMTADEKGDLGDYVLTALPGLLISSKFRNAIQATGVDNIQYVDAEIYDEISHETHSDYYVANVIGLVDCIDMKKSKLTMRAALPDKIRSIDELHLDEARARGQLLFRLARRSTLVMFAESIKKAVESAALKGVGFDPAEGYST